MTSKLLVRLSSYCQGEGPEQRIHGLWALWVAWQVQGCEHSPSTGDWQGELHSTFYTKASHGKQRSCFPHTAHLAIWSLRVSDGSSGCDPKAFCTLQTKRKTVPVLKDLSLFFNHSSYIMSFLYTHLCYIKQNYTKVMDIAENIATIYVYYHTK